jgi:carbon monoxide dehydrogenase subunit G
MLKKILRYIFIGIATFTAIGFFLPGKTHVERQMTITAPNSVVFNQINELKNWAAWSPWQDLDPNAQWTYAPQTAGIGAWYSWAGNNKVGSGKMTILDSDSTKNLHCKMEFGGAADSFADFKLTPKDSTNTLVVWAFDTDHGINPFARWFGLGFDGFIGNDYQKGLLKLKAVCENIK